jgi:ABC-type oligopeptide transport system substrate-binding subunit/class 3 adenylate cyclase
MEDTLPSLTCPNCSHKNPGKAKFCQNCGQLLARLCSACGTQNEPTAKFCMDCGKPLDLATPEIEETRLTKLQQSAPAGLKEKMRASSSQIEGERKPVTILFADIVGSTSMAEKLDPEEWKEVVSGAHQRVGEAIYRYEGTIAQLLGDGVLAFFGAPITHEDDPIRAVRAALDIQESIKNYAHELADLVDRFQIRIGINSGEVVVGSIGTDMHMEYLAIGDAVNIAARLQGSAEPGKALLSESTARLIASEFDLKDLGTIELKGKEEAVSIFEVIGMKDRSMIGRHGDRLYSPLVGREREIEHLKETLIQLCKGHGQIVTILGEAGIGKSRLLNEIQTLSRQDLSISVTDQEADLWFVKPSDLHWLEARAISYGGGLSYWTMSQLLLADLGLSDGASEVKMKVALKQRIHQLFGDEGTSTLPFLFRLLGIAQDQETKDSMQTFDGETLKRQIHHSIREYFAALAKMRPTVLIFEDMHWADPSSLEVLGELLNLTDRLPLMILILMRMDRDHGSWDITARANRDFSHRYSEIPLKRLSTSQSEQLVHHLLGIQQLPKQIKGLILARSEGNPFYLEEVIHHLVGQNLIIQDDQGWHATPSIEEVGIPDTLRGVLLARIDRLEEDVRKTLQQASVIGRSFLYRLLKAIAEAERELDDHLSQLQRVGLVYERARLPELEYIFKHSLTQEAAYNSLLHGRRREFHLRVGEALEKLFADRKEEFIGFLAYHFEAADASERAVEYLIQAGDKARWEDAFEEATGYYHRALKHIMKLGDERRASQTWLKLGLISMSNFDFEGAHQAHEAAFNLGQKVKSLVDMDIAPKKPPKILRIVETSQPRELDPGTSGWVHETQIVNQIFAGLAELDTEMNVVPHVARSWEMLDGGKRYLFHLRDDVYWTDGSPVTAEDFRWAWTRNLTHRTGSFMQRIYDDIVGAHEFRTGKSQDPDTVGLRALNSKTFEVRLNKPRAYFIYLVTLPGSYPLPREVVQQYGAEWWKPEHIVSNGAFRLTECDEDHITLEKNPTYFSHVPGNLQRVEIFNIPEIRTRVRLFNNHEVDVAWIISPKSVPEGLSKDEIHHPNFALSLRYVILNPQQAPLHDVRVRRALAYALDRRRIVESAIGEGTSPASGIIPVGLPGHSPELGFRFDPSNAQRLLAEAGYPDGKGLPQIYISYFPVALQYEMIAEIVRQWEEHLGIQVVFDEFPLEIDWPPTLETHGKIFGWAADYTDPDSFLRQSEIIDTLKHWGWKNDYYMELVELAAQTPNRSHRMAMYRQADHILVEDEVLIIPIWYGGEWLLPQLLKPSVKNYHRNPLGFIPFKDIILE